MSEKEDCEGCEVALANLTLEEKLMEIEARIEAIELILDSFKELLLEKVGLIAQKV